MSQKVVFINELWSINYVPTTGKRIIGTHKVRITVVLFTGV